MVLKLQLDFSWISFCSKIGADQEHGIWTSLEHHLGTIEFFEKISNQNSNFEDFEKFEKISRCENNEKMTFKIVIFGFNFCQKATSQVPSQKQAKFKHWFDSFSLSSSPKIIRKWPFWPEIWKIQKFRKFRGHLELFSGRKMKWYQENAIIWPDFLKRLNLGEISKMLA